MWNVHQSSPFLMEMVNIKAILHHIFQNNDKAFLYHGVDNEEQQIYLCK